MFTKEEGEDVGMDAPSDQAETIIGPTVKVEGTFQSDDNILIDGEIVGTIKTSKDLTVGEGARIEADIEAANMFVAGDITGNIKVSGTMQLSSSARIKGDIETQIISVETGAVIQGQCVSGQGGSTPTQDEEEKETETEEDDD
ncbi:polymer-forming cytoskeletal protein [Patescibacteria group bacterium]